MPQKHDPNLPVVAPQRQSVTALRGHMGEINRAIDEIVRRDYGRMSPVLREAVVIKDEVLDFFDNVHKTAEVALGLVKDFSPLMKEREQLDREYPPIEFPKEVQASLTKIWRESTLQGVIDGKVKRYRPGKADTHDSTRQTLPETADSNSREVNETNRIAATLVQKVSEKMVDELTIVKKRVQEKDGEGVMAASVRMQEATVLLTLGMIQHLAVYEKRMEPALPVASRLKVLNDSLRKAVHKSIMKPL